MPLSVRILRISEVAVHYAVLAILSVITAAPLLWMISTSLKDPTHIFAAKMTWLPNPIKWSNYKEAWEGAPFWMYFWNTLKITATVLVGRLFVCAMAGYAFARLTFAGQRVAFSILMVAVLIPGTVTLIPQYFLFKNLGWINTHYPLIVPGIVANTFGTFLFRQFFATIPKELEEAATIDGAGTFMIFWRIMLPLAKPAAGALGIFTFVSSWNDFLGPLIFLHSKSKMTLQIGLASMSTEFGTQWHLLMGASLIVMLPVLIVYFVAQGQFEKGLVTSGLKG